VDDVPGWMTLLHCPGAGRSAMVTSTAEGVARELASARLLLQKVRCRRTGEPTQVWSAAMPRAQ